MYPWFKQKHWCLGNSTQGKQWYLNTYAPTKAMPRASCVLFSYRGGNEPLREKAPQGIVISGCCHWEERINRCKDLGRAGGYRCPMPKREQSYRETLELNAAFTPESRAWNYSQEREPQAATREAMRLLTQPVGDLWWEGPSLPL